LALSLLPLLFDIPPELAHRNRIDDL